MLNTNQSHKRNSWKYALIVPMLLGFVFLFQVKIIAQEKIVKVVCKEIQKDDKATVVITKKTTDAELKSKTKKLKEEHDVKLKYSRVKRNSNGEITGIKLEYKDKDGNKGVSQVNGDEPIAPIQFYKTDNKIGFGKPKGIHLAGNGKSIVINGDKIKIISPEATVTPDKIEWNEDIVLDMDFDLANNMDEVKKIIIEKGQEPMVIINDKGKVKRINSRKDKKESYSFSFKSDDGTNEIIIDDKKIIELTDDAMKKAMVEIKRIKPEVREKVRAEMAKVRAELSKSRAEMAKSRAEMRHNNSESEKAHAEIMKTREEIAKVRAELEKAKAEIEKEKAKLKK